MNLSPNKRIALNIIVTYGRSLFALVCGLLVGRWSLLALGETDYGLSAVVGGLAVFISFINSLMAGAVGRFYAYTIGIGQKDRETALQDGRKWFNSALLIHTAGPALLLLIGYPVGLYAVQHWIGVPLERMDACIWVWRFVCINCLIGMVTVPFGSFFYAKQLLVEPTIYSMITVLLNAGMLYYMVTHPGDWLIFSAFWTCLLGVSPEIVKMIRAFYLFPECRFYAKYLWSWTRTKALLNYAGWMMFGALGAISKNQLLAILVNKQYGPNVTAAVSVANHVSGNLTIFSGGMINAFQPAIVNACGAKDFTRMRKLAFMTCKFGTMLIVFFALPVALELPKIMQVWLKTPPKYTVELCWFILAMVVIDKTTVGHQLAINANGKIALYQAVLGSILVLTCPLAWWLIVCGTGVYSVGISLVTTMAFCAWGRVFFARCLVDMSIGYWLRKIMLPLFLTITVSGGVGFLPQLVMPASLLRIFVTGVCTEIVLITLTWLFLFDRKERDVIMMKLKIYMNKVTGNAATCTAKPL